MRATRLLVVAIAAIPVAGARADSFDIGDLFRRTQTMIESLVGLGRGGDQYIIAPPGNIDPKMAFEPPRSAGTMPIIRPSEPFEQRR